MTREIQWRIQDFPEMGVPTLQGAPTYDFFKFSQKLHEIERIWIPAGADPGFPIGGGANPPGGVANL